MIERDVNHKIQTRWMEYSYVVPQKILENYRSYKLSKREDQVLLTNSFRGVSGECSKYKYKIAALAFVSCRCQEPFSLPACTVLSAIVWAQDPDI